LRPREPGRQAKKVEKMWPTASTRPVVLIVEDEILLLMDAMDFLEAAGFEVVDAKNADDAIAILEQRNDIKLIFTDIDMPGSMDGLKLAHFVKNRWPPIKIIATSGHAKIEANDLPEGSRFIPKPYQAPQVAETIHQLIQPHEIRHSR
jgi:CheY-like chemotaxis protein